VLSALNGAVCFDTPLHWFIAAWTAWHFLFAGKAPYTIHYNQTEGIAIKLKVSRSAIRTYEQGGESAADSA